MAKLTDFSAVIFDLDGLVLDTETTFGLARQKAVSLMGYNMTEAFCHALSGLSSENIAAEIRATLGVDFNLAEFNTLTIEYWCEQVNRYGINVKSGFRELLNTIIKHKLPYCLATNSNANNAQHCLAYAGLSGIFEIVVSRDDVSQGKPEPDIFLTAAERLQVNIADCLVLEDSYAGIMAGFKAGAFVAWVSSTETADEIAMNYCHLKVNDLVALLETLNEQVI